MVGTGPYVLDSYSQSQQAVSRNPNYWGGWEGEHFDQLIVSYVKEPATERLLLEQGEVDIALFLPDDAVEELDGPRESSSPTCPPSICIIWYCRPGRSDRGQDGAPGALIRL